MEIGPFEIGLIIVIAVIMLLIFRVSRMSHKPVRTVSKGGKTTVTAKTEDSEPEEGSNARRYSGIAGLGMILVSIILLWSGARLLKWVFWSYSWFLILAVVGIVLLFISRRRE